MKTRILTAAGETLRMARELSGGLIDALRAMSRGRPRLVRLVERHDGIVRSHLPGF